MLFEQSHSLTVSGDLVSLRTPLVQIGIKVHVSCQVLQEWRSLGLHSLETVSPLLRLNTNGLEAISECSFPIAQSGRKIAAV